MTAEQTPHRNADTSHAVGTDVVGLRIVGLVVDDAVSGLVGFVIILNSRNRRRLGDMVAETLVVRS